MSIEQKLWISYYHYQFYDLSDFFNPIFKHFLTKESFSAVEPTRTHNDYHLSLQSEPRGSPRTTTPFMSKPEGTYTVRDNEAY